MKRTMKKIGCFLLTILCLFCAFGCNRVGNNSHTSFGQTDTLVQNVQRAFRSVASITCIDVDSSGLEIETYGSAVVFRVTDKGAYLLTNYHVICSEAGEFDAQNITVSFFGGVSDSSAHPILVGATAEYDLAVLFLIGATEIFPLIEQVSVAVEDIVAGDGVFIIGNSLGAGLSVTEGMVSVAKEKVVINRQNGWTCWETRVNAALNHGCSGGGSFTENGNWMGVTQARNGKDGVESVGYVIPAKWASAVAENMIRAYEFGVTPQVFRFGVTFEGVDPVCSLTSDGFLNVAYLVCVKNLTNGSVGAVFLKEGDSIVSCKVNRNPTVSVSHAYDLELLLLAVSIGDTLQIDYRRNNESFSFTFTVEQAHMVTLE